MLFRLFSILSSFLFLGACSPHYYVPNAQNIPMISAKDDLALSFMADETQFNFQGAYGIKNNLAIQANFFHYDIGKANWGKANFFEAGAGYYNSDLDQLNFEIYGLLGAGDLTAHFDLNNSSTNRYTNGDLRASFIRYGVQPIIGHKSKYFAIAFSTRLLFLKYQKVQGDLVYYDADQVDYLKNRKTHYLVEPALTIRTGFKKLKLQAQFVYSSNKSFPDFEQVDEILTFGVVVELNAKKSASNKRK